MAIVLENAQEPADPVDAAVAALVEAATASPEAYTPELLGLMLAEAIAEAANPAVADTLATPEEKLKDRYKEQVADWHGVPLAAAAHEKMAARHGQKAERSERLGLPANAKVHRAAAAAHHELAAEKKAAA